jgi:hypothetical protein
MKRLLQILIPIVVLMSACQKEQSLEVGNNNPNPGGPGTGGPGTGGGGNNTGYYIKCKIGGTAKTFDVGASAISETDQGETITVVGGKANSNPNDTEQFSFLISSTAALATGTYKVDNLSGSYTMVASYTPNGGAAAFLTGTGLIFGTPFKVNITSLNTTEIAGTFSGSLFEIDITNPNPSPNPPQKAVTEGEFKVKFQ